MYSLKVYLFILNSFRNTDKVKFEDKKNGMETLDIQSNENNIRIKENTMNNTYAISTLDHIFSTIIAVPVLDNIFF